MSAITAVRVRAPAKVNLTLRILGRRPSGFHDLETLFQAVDLCDELTLRRTASSGVTLRVRGADVGPLRDNLVTRAAEAFLAAAAPGRAGTEAEGGAPDRLGVAIELKKHIPAGAGLGGGSSDAGATLRALDRIWPGAMSAEALQRIAASLGSDVPFFTGTAGLAAGRGRGERLRPLSPLPEAWIVLGVPTVHVATGPAYAALAAHRAEAGGRAPRSVLGDVADTLRSGEAALASWAGVARVAVNDFETTVCAEHPAIARALTALRETDPVLSLLSGSGGAVYAVFEDEAAAERARARAAAAVPETPFAAVRTLARLPAMAGP